MTSLAAEIGAMVLLHTAGKHPEASFTLDEDFLDNCSGDASLS